MLTDVDEPSGRMDTMLIRNEHLGLWKVSEEEILQRAEANTKKLLPYEFTTMYTMNPMITEILEGRDMDEEGCKRPGEQEDMYVLTNHMWSGGASAVLYPGRLDAIGEYLKGNYYILPSSVHEVIIVPEYMAPPKEGMENIVKAVNEEEVQTEEFLSNHVYFYDRVRKETILV